MILCAKLLCSIALSIICTRQFRGEMHSDWFNGIEMLQGRWHHGEKVGYCYPSGLEKTLCKWDIAHSIICILIGSTEQRYFKIDGIMEKKWDTVLEKTLCKWDIVHSIICILTGSTEQRYFKIDGIMEKKWDTVIPADLKRLFVSGTLYAVSFAF